MKTKNFINKAIIKHGNRYDYSKVEYANNNTKVCIICPKHGEFWQMPKDHLDGCGCPLCCKRNRRYTQKEFIEKAKKIHGDKYDYSKVEYVNNNIKVCIICPEHGEFWQMPKLHLKGSGCPLCCKRNKQYTQKEFIEKAISIHGNKYDYSKVEYIDGNTKVCIICPEHGEFWQTPHAHLNKRGCNKCVRPSYDTESFIKCSKEIHGDKYDYSKVEYVNTKTKVCIICPEHGEFWMKPNVHLQGSGCALCLKKGEDKLYIELVNYFGFENVTKQKTFTWLVNKKTNHQQYLDFYIENYNIAFELQGDQHFVQHRAWDKNKDSFSKRKEMDLNKKCLCDEYGVKIYYITFNTKWEHFLGEKIYHNLFDIKF